jgi:hypothetical protein
MIFSQFFKFKIRILLNSTKWVCMNLDFVGIFHGGKEKEDDINRCLRNIKVNLRFSYAIFARLIFFRIHNHYVSAYGRLDVCI